MAAHLRPRGDAVVAAAAGIERLRVELLVRGAGLERVRGGEVTAFGFQVGAHLNTNTGLLGVCDVLRCQYADRRLRALPTMLWDRCRMGEADCPAWTSRASPCPRDRSHSNILS